MKVLPNTRSWFATSALGVIVLVTSSLPGSMPGSFEYRSSSTASDSCRLLDVENSLYEGSSRRDSALDVDEVNVRAQGERTSRGSNIFVLLLRVHGQEVRSEIFRLRRGTRTPSKQ